MHDTAKTMASDPLTSGVRVDSTSPSLLSSCLLRLAFSLLLTHEAAFPRFLAEKSNVQYVLFRRAQSVCQIMRDHNLRLACSFVLEIGHSSGQ